MPAYDHERFDPPAPTVMVSLRHPESGVILPDVAMLLDTGADVSLIPQASVDSRGVKASGRTYEVVGVDNKSGIAQMVSLTCSFCEKYSKANFC